MNFSVNALGATEGFCLVRSVEKKVNVKGVPYLDLTLCDKTGEINAKIWDYKEIFHGVYEPGELIKVRGSVTQYNGADQLKIDKIRKVMPSDGVDISEFVPSAQYAGRDMLNEIYKVIALVKDEEFKKLTYEMIKENEEKLLFWPAAYKLHHAIRGGLLFHTLSILRMAQAVCKIYPSINCDLLYCGAILHDISKLDEFEISSTGIVTSYSVKGELLGHLVMGSLKVAQKAKDLGIDENKAMLLEHMIISHHGSPEFGAAVRPMFLEAEILSQLDCLDATIYEIEEAAGGVNEGEFTQRQWALDNRKLYNTGLGTLETKANLL